MPDPWRCAVLKDRRGGLSPLPVAMARGKHLFPFRTEQLSPSAPMVLGSQGPGRVGRRRFFHEVQDTGRLPAALRRSRPNLEGQAWGCTYTFKTACNHSGTQFYFLYQHPMPCPTTSRCSRGRGGGGEAELRQRGRLASSPGNGSPAQRRSMRMRRLTRWLVLIDLPVDGIVVLEREERAGEVQRIERAPGER